MKKHIPCEYKGDFFTAAFPAAFKSELITKDYGSKQITMWESKGISYIVDFTYFNEDYAAKLPGGIQNLANVKRAALMN